MKRSLVLSVCFVLFFRFLIFDTYAYFPNSAFTLPLPSNLPVGSIIAETADDYVAASSKDTESFVGVIVEDADFVYEADETTTRPVVSNGIVPILLSNEKGPIMKGDEITISKTQPGVGVKAQQQDIVLGVAQKSVNLEGKTLVDVKIIYNGNSGSAQSLKDNSVLADELSNLVKNSSNRIVSGETNPALYLLAIIVVILAAVFAFILFGRVAINGIAAIGRNPMAKGAIITGIVINSLLVIAFMIGTLFAAAYIIGW